MRLRLNAVREPEGLTELRHDVRAFLAEQRGGGGYTAHVDAWLSGIDPEFSRALGQRGFLGVTFPSAYGGRGASWLERYAITEELLAAGAPVAAHWIAERQSGPSILRYGTEDQKRRYVPGIAAGEVFFAIGMSEPDSGSDLASVRTRAVRVPGGWRINGAKIWTSVAHVAHAMIALVRTAPATSHSRHAGLSQFIIDLLADGVEIRPIVSMDGGHHFNEVVFHDVLVQDGDLLGVESDGWAQCTSELALERSGPERVLSTLPLLLTWIDTLRRDPWRRDGATDRAVAALMARLWVLRQMSLAVADALGRGVSPEVEAALVKDLGTRLEAEIVEVVTGIVGHQPDPTSDEPLARMAAEALLHMPGLTLRGGTSEILRGVVARGLGVR